MFDLDNTLIAGDSDYAWGEFLADCGYVDAELWRVKNQRFYSDYCRGCLDMREWLRFSLTPLRNNDIQLLKRWRARFMRERIEPMRDLEAEGLLAEHRAAGDDLLIITATNRFIAEPIAEMLGIDTLLATEPEICDGAYTGEIYGEPCFSEGKVLKADSWLQQRGLSWQGTAFYSDSHNDLPLLERVETPIAVNPDKQLSQFAEQFSWKIVRTKAASHAADTSDGVVA